MISLIYYTFKWYISVLKLIFTVIFILCRDSGRGNLSTDTFRFNLLKSRAAERNEC